MRPFWKACARRCAASIMTAAPDAAAPVLPPVPGSAHLPAAKGQTEGGDRARLAGAGLELGFADAAAGRGQAYVNDTKALMLLKERLDGAIARAAQFWPVAAEAMQPDAGNRGRPPRRRRNASAMPLPWKTHAEMALLLAAGEVIEQLSALLPAPVASFNEQLVWEVRDIYDRLVNRHPDAAPYVAVITMNRLSRPWEALRLPLLVTRHTDETLISKTDMGLVGEILFARMEALQAIHPGDAPSALRRRKADGAGQGVRRSFQHHRQGNRAQASRASGASACWPSASQIGNVMESFMERAPREVGAALPMQKATGADFSKPLAPEKRDMALRYARLVAGSRNFAAAASFAAKQHATSEELRSMLKRYNEDLVKALKAEPRNADRRRPIPLSARK